MFVAGILLVGYLFLYFQLLKYIVIKIYHERLILTLVLKIAEYLMMASKDYRLTNEIINLYKLKLQPYDHKSKDDILTYLSEFEAVAKQAKWTKEVKVLHCKM
jgi:hypothetical protein